jgi:branched-chain amino acid transport system ATP-binding protein
VSEPLLKVDGLTKRFGGLVANDAIDLEIFRGELHAVIGPNGAGKTTFIGLLAGELAADAGRISVDGRDVTHMPVYDRALFGLARSFQITSVFPHLSVLDNVLLAVQAHRGHSFRFWRPARSIDGLRRPALEALTQVGLAERAATLAVNISHGERRQLEIAMALASGPKLLLLDEPTAGMGAEETQRMVSVLKGLKGRHAILLIEHDMDVVFTLADRITVMVNGQPIASGRPEEIRANPEVRKAYLG